MNGVVDGIKVLGLGEFGDAELVLTGSSLGVHAFLQIGLGVPHDLAQQLGELGCVLGLFPGPAR